MQTVNHTLYVVRHGENPANLNREFSYKLIDYSLTPKGFRQAEDTDEAGTIRIQAEPSGLVQVLRDIAGEDSHKEGRRDPAERDTVPGERDQGRTEGDLHDAGGQHHEVRTQR